MLAHQSTSTRFQIPPDQYVAYCYGSVGLGTQKTNFQGVEKYPRQVALLFVFPTVLMPVTEKGKEPRPASLFKSYNLTLDEKSKLTAELQNWLGRKITDEDRRKFDTSSLIGMPGLAQVIINTNGKSCIYKVSQLPSWMKQNLPPNPFANSTIDYDVKFGKNATYERIFPHLRAIIDQSYEFTGVPIPTATGSVAAIMPQPAQVAVPNPAPAPAPETSEPTDDGNNPF